MRKLLVVLSGLLAAASAVPFLESATAEWNAFKIEYGKKYDSETEERFRMKVFEDNKHKIDQHNRLYEDGLVTHKMALNRFADLLHHEFVDRFVKPNRSINLRTYTGESKPVEDPISYIEPANIEIADSVDWRNQGAVTEVKDQGQVCGSCWTFAATGALEGQHFRKTGELVSLSEQNLVDCSASYGNYGCDGGSVDRAFQYIKDNGGINTEESYEYTEHEGVCKYNASNSGAIVRGYVMIPTGSERKLTLALATVGPIAVAIDASHLPIQFYSSDIYYERDCQSNLGSLEHAVLAVGYGTDENGQDYYIVKNSWGADWGDKGYFKMARNRNNNCGIATEAMYPLV